MSGPPIPSPMALFDHHGERFEQTSILRGRRQAAAIDEASATRIERGSLTCVRVGSTPKAG